MSSEYLTGPPEPWLLRISVLEGRVGLRLAGEADIAGLDALRSAIAGLPPGAAVVHMQRTGLEFNDVAAARELVLLTRRAGSPRLVLHCPRLALMRLIRLLWPASREQIQARGGKIPA